jgi:soluble lytic murein transglycosylase
VLQLRARPLRLWSAAILSRSRGFRTRRRQCQTVPYLTLLRILIFLVSVASSGVAAQSAATLEAVRLHRSDALKLAQSELANCSPPACARLAELSLLTGYLLLADGRAAEAVQQLSSIPAPHSLEAFHAYYLGEAYFYDHDKRAAAAEFARAAQRSEGRLQSRARARQGEALLAAGAVREALGPLEVAAAEADSPELLYQRATARARVGNFEGARADFKALAIRFPLHPCAALAVSETAGVPELAIDFALDEGLSRARAFIDAGQPRLALEELATAERHSSAEPHFERARVALLRAMALFALGRDTEAEAQIKLTARGPNGIAAEAILLRAKRALKANQNDLARRYMAEIERRYPKEPSADEAGFFLGWIDLQAGRWPAAVKSFMAFERRHPHSRRRDEVVWFEGLALILQRKYNDSRQTLRRLVRQFASSALVPQARYWSARSLQLAGGDIDGMADEYQQVVRLFPGSFYSLLAGSRLRDLGRERPNAFPESPKAPSGPAPFELALALALSDAGLARDAASEAAHRVESARNSSEAVRIGHALQQMGEYGRAYGLAARMLWGNAYGNKDGESLSLLYPRAYQPLVEQLAKEQSVDPYFIWAIMRRESSFRADVTSAANARGLMQVFPPTAVEISKRLAMEAPAPEELFSAEVNVRFAAWYLAQLRARFGHPALCAAAYNAGPGPVNRWLSERGDLPVDLFVERIPYKETRAYVKQVVADYFTYRQLYETVPGNPAASNPDFDLALPTEAKEGVSF